MAVVAFISERGISLRTLPDPLPAEWYIPVPVERDPSVIKVEPEWRLVRYGKLDGRTYVENEEEVRK